MLRFLHCADLHPQSHATFAGKTLTDPETGLNQALTDMRRSLEEIALCVKDPEAPCDFALISGDIFDSDHPTMDEVRVIQDGLAQIRVPVYIIPGNHDSPHNPAHATALRTLAGMRDVRLFERPEVFRFPVHDQLVELFALPYPFKSRLAASTELTGASPEEVTARINHGLVEVVRALKLRRSPHCLHVMMAHGSVMNAKVGLQPRSLADDILLPLAEMEEFLYVALGHIHQRQQVAENAFYPSSVLRLDFGEEHEDKGWLVVEIDDRHKLTVYPQENPWARKFKTLTLRDAMELEWQGVSPEHVYRIQDTVSASVLDEARPLLDKWCAEHPLTQLNIKVETAERVRDKDMSATLSVESALERALAQKQVPEEQWPDLLGRHRRLDVEVGA